MIDERPVALDLCSGAGGGTVGLEAAGYRTVSFDNWQPAIDTHHANGLECHRLDLMSVGDALWQAYAGRVDLLFGGPPCQPFSAAGKGRGHWDARDAIPGFIRAVQLVQPRVFVMENVRGLTFRKHADYLAQVLEGFEAAGYVIEHRVLNAADYGVPQTRQRLFVIGRRDGEPITWPEQTHAKVPTDDLLPWVTMAQALGWTDGRSWSRFADVRRNDQTGTDEVDRDWPLSRPSTTIAGRDIVPDPGANANRFNGKAKSRNDGYRVEPGEAAALQGFPTWVTERPAPTVGSTHGGVAGRQVGGHVNLSTAQASILQAFPHGFAFTGNRTTVFRQIGNACPPPFTYLIAKANAGAELAAEAVA